MMRVEPEFRIKQLYLEESSISIYMYSILIIPHSGELASLSAILKPD